jgi:hypothetical protein
MLRDLNRGYQEAFKISPRAAEDYRTRIDAIFNNPSITRAVTENFSEVEKSLAAANKPMKKGEDAYAQYVKMTKETVTNTQSLAEAAQKAMDLQIKFATSDKIRKGIEAQTKAYREMAAEMIKADSPLSKMVQLAEIFEKTGMTGVILNFGDSIKQMMPWTSALVDWMTVFGAKSAVTAGLLGDSFDKVISRLADLGFIAMGLNLLFAKPLKNLVSLVNWTGKKMGKTLGWSFGKAYQHLIPHFIKLSFQNGWIWIKMYAEQYKNLLIKKMFQFGSWLIARPKKWFAIIWNATKNELMKFGASAFKYIKSLPGRLVSGLAKGTSGIWGFFGKSLSAALGKIAGALGPKIVGILTRMFGPGLAAKIIGFFARLGPLIGKGLSKFLGPIYAIADAIYIIWRDWDQLKQSFEGKSFGEKLAIGFKYASGVFGEVLNDVLFGIPDYIAKALGGTSMKKAFSGMAQIIIDGIKSLPSFWDQWLVVPFLRVKETFNRFFIGIFEAINSFIDRVPDWGPFKEMKQSVKIPEATIEGFRKSADENAQKRWDIQGKDIEEMIADQMKLLKRDLTDVELGKIVKKAKDAQILKFKEPEPAKKSETKVKATTTKQPSPLPMKREKEKERAEVKTKRETAATERNRGVQAQEDTATALASLPTVAAGGGNVTVNVVIEGDMAKFMRAFAKQQKDMQARNGTAGLMG